MAVVVLVLTTLTLFLILGLSFPCLSLCSDDVQKDTYRRFG